tara:strand:- start:8 stop:694 length:687 start_codon:yes stop_codon:yes gene_type:complete
MNKLKTILFAVCSLVLVTTGMSVKADSGNFAGPYVGVTASGYGIEAAGTANSSTESEDSTSTTNDALKIGAVAGVVGLEAGYALPLGSAMLIDLGATYHSGEAKIDHDNDDGDGGGAVAFMIDDLVTFYVAPTLVLSDTSSLYVKVGLSEADTGVTGDITTPGKLSGTTWAIGTRTVLDSGVFIRTEAGYTDYNGISAHGKGTNIQSSSTYSAEPTIAFGTVSLGFRF